MKKSIILTLFVTLAFAGNVCAAVMTTNETLTAFRAIEGGDYTVTQFTNGIVDGYTDEAGIDNGNSDTDQYTTAIIDSTGRHSVIRTGQSRLINTTNIKNGGALATDNDSKIYFLDSDDWHLGGGTGDFTIEAWVNFNSFNETEYIWSQGWDYGGSNYNRILFFINSNNIYFISDSNAGMNVYFKTPHTLSTNTWYHIVLSRVDNADSASSWRIYVDGDSKPLTLISGDYDATIQNNIGIGNVGGYISNYFNGMISEFRLSDADRYSSLEDANGDFTPQTTPFESDSNTQLLLHFKSPHAPYFTDSVGSTGITSTKYDAGSTPSDVKLTVFAEDKTGTITPSDISTTVECGGTEITMGSFTNIVEYEDNKYVLEKTNSSGVTCTADNKLDYNLTPDNGDILLHGASLSWD